MNAVSSENYPLKRINAADFSTIALLPSTNMGFTGNIYLDGILWGGNRWDTGPSKQIDYSFWNLSGYNWFSVERAAMVKVLNTWSAVTNINFVNAGDNNPDATFKFNLVDNAQVDNYLSGFFPPGTDLEGFGFFNWESPYWDFRNGNQQGDLGFAIMIHELGHGLGLAHPHDHGGSSPIYPGVTSWFDTGDFGLNQGVYTTMSYNYGFGGSSGSKYYGYQGTPMAFDIAAIQHLYGANLNHASGHDLYQLPTSNAPGNYYEAIWDVSGIDTISANHTNINVTINLQEAPLTGANAGGYISSVAGIAGGFTIANGVTIENALGGMGNDFIVGNYANNELNGSMGQDKLNGLVGRDTLYGEADQDQLFGGTENDVLYGGDAQDSLFGGFGDDLLYGEDHDDWLYGGAKDDILYGNSGNDSLYGGFGDEELIDMRIAEELKQRQLQRLKENQKNLKSK